MHFESFLGTAILAALTSAPAGWAQTTAPEGISKHAVSTKNWKRADWKPGNLERVPARDQFIAEPKSTAHYSKKQFVILSVAVYGAGLADMHQTLEVRRNSWWYETDPLARPFVRLPAPAYYATGLAMATGINWLSWKMGHSRKCRKLSPLPQILAIAGNLHGFQTNRY